MRVALASERRPKVEAVHTALSRIAALDATTWGGFDLVTRSMPSGVRDTPLHDDELRQGARRRALALEEVLEQEGRPARIYLGLEGGAHFDGDERDRAWLRSWCFAWDGEDGSFGSGPSLLLPAPIARALHAGEDLAMVIDRVADGVDLRSQGGTWGFLTRDLLPRSLAFETAVLAALARFYHPAAFRTHRPHG